MRPFLLTLLLACLPLLLGYYLNASAPHPPTRTYVPTRCTRYCTLHGCRHATRANSPAYFQLRPLYKLTIKLLQTGGNYQLANIGFYMVLLPTGLLWLTYGALRDAGRIQQLKRQRP